MATLAGTFLFDSIMWSTMWWLCPFLKLVSDMISCLTIGRQPLIEFAWDLGQDLVKNKLHILVSVSKIYDNVNDYVAVAIVTSYSARMLYLGPTRDMYSEIWSARLYPLVKILVYKVLVQMDRLIKFIYQYCRFWG